MQHYGKTATLGQIAEVIRRQEGIKDVKIDGDKDATEGYIYVETTDGEIFEIYYDGTTGTIKIEYIRKSRTRR